MPPGRPTSDPKGNSIRVRVNDETKHWLYNKANLEGKTVSEYVRDLIQRDMTK